MVVPGRRSLGGFEVARVLPFATRRVVGPFVLFEHMGPLKMRVGVSRCIDVLPHPHIGLALPPICSSAKSCVGAASVPNSSSSRAKSTG